MAEKTNVIQSTAIAKDKIQGCVVMITIIVWSDAQSKEFSTS